MIEEWLSQAMHIAMVVFGFGFLIFVHEFGHFVVAKWKGVKVTKFSLGFGPAIFTFRMGETLYALSIIPLGGFCKLAGERLQEKDEQPEQEDADIPPERLLTSKTVGQRALIFAAGSFLNLAVAFPLGVLMVMIGGPAPIAKVSVAPGGAYTAGIHSGDVIKSVNDRPVHYWSEMVEAVKKAPIKEPFPVTVDRDGSVKTYQVLRADESDHLGLQLQAETVIGFVHPAGPARKAGIKLGDELISVAKLGEPAVPIKRWQDFEDVIRSSPSAQVMITVKRKTSDRNGGHMTAEIAVTPDKETDYELGVEYGNGADAVIQSVQGDSPASRAGMQPGDRITAIDGKGTRTWVDITSAVKEAGLAIPISLLRDGREINLTVEREAKDDLIGIASAGSLLMIKEVKDDSPAQQAGLMAGDIILKIGKKKVENLPDGKLFTGGQAHTVTIKRGNDTLTATVTPRAEIHGKVGVGASPATEFRRSSFPAAISEGVGKTVHLFGLTFKLLYGLFRLEISPDNLAGPVGIISLSYMQAQTGLHYFVHFLMMITISLGIFNLLPIPILDGGHIAFLFIEKIKGKAVSDRTFAIAQYTGLVFLLALVLYVTRNDVMNFIL